MDFSYKKTDNQKLFESLEKNKSFGILNSQNYIPIYNSFFTLSKDNYNNVTLNNKCILNSLTEKTTNNIFKGVIKKNKEKKNKNIFLKFSPLLDPSKYLLGKYDINDENLFNLPLYNSNNSHPKMNDYNNSAYVDSFFSYLSSKLLHDYSFSHGLDFYGSFLAVKEDFRINITDDVEYLNDSAFFKKNYKILYELEENISNQYDDDTRNNRKKITMLNDTSCDNILELSDINDLLILDTVFEHNSIEAATTTTTTFDGVNEINEINDKNIIELTSDNLQMRINKSSSNSSNSTCSSRSSNTTNDVTDLITNDDADADVDANDEEEDDANYSDVNSGSDEGSDYEYEDEDEIIAKIKKFPVQVIALENCEDTLDSLLNKTDKIKNNEWDSIVMQILFSLITFQNAFGLTHNDLHTNNIMYINTDKPFLYYKLNHIYYKVPTFGKLFKIIDFGRAIYKFRGQTLCSDSYHKDGDAFTQYNCEPYLNDKKPRLEPNYSFDLCRLGCALYDTIVDEPQTKIIKIMMDWCIDDKGRNVLYKKNGDERYPEFKLYKMIARTVNKHIPIDVLNNDYFNKYIVKMKDIGKNCSIMDLDAIPRCM